MDNAERERELRRLERDGRRREQGRESFFQEPRATESFPVVTDLAEQTTTVIRPEDIHPPEVAEARPRLSVSAAIFGAATGVSRVLGLVREVITAYYFGAAGKSNAFPGAVQPPHLFR